MSTVVVPYHQDERIADASFPVPRDAEVITVAGAPAGDSLWERLGDLYERTAGVVAAEVTAGDTPRVVSGDCLVNLAVLAGVQRAGIDPVLVWFDAHGDVHTTETSTSGYPGGMALRLALGADPELLGGRLGLRPVPERDAVLVDARDLDPAEVTYLAAADIRRCGVDELDANVTAGRPVILHIDVDVIDPGELPGLRFPVPDGHGSALVVAAARRILAGSGVVAVDIACPWHPAEGTDQQRRAELLAEILAPA